MSHNILHRTAIKPVIVATAVSATLTILLVFTGCSRHDAPITPAPVSAADRAEPLPVTETVEPTAPASATAQTASRKIPLEDTLEPVAIDDANVPSNSASLTGQHKKK